jgi:hypothetical protein
MDGPEPGAVPYLRTSADRRLTHRALAARPGRRRTNPPEPMNRNRSQARTPAQIRAGNRRLGLVLLAVVAVFFIAAVVKQWIASTS